MLNMLDFKPFFLNTSHFIKSKINKHIIRPEPTWDTLFWCFYILKHGYSKYETLLQSLTIISEKQIKIEYIQQIRLNKSLIKTLKHKPGFHYEDQLANANKIDIYTFFVLCHLENINITYIVNRSFYITYDLEESYIDLAKNYTEENNNINEIIHDPDEYTDESELSDIDVDNSQYIPVLHKDSYNNYYLKYTNTSYIKWNTLCKIYKLDQPLKPISHYTVNNLQQLYSKINNSIPYNHKKTEIYNELQTFLKLI